jgi:hypothetical protein
MENFGLILVKNFNQISPYVYVDSILELLHQLDVRIGWGVVPSLASKESPLSHPPPFLSKHNALYTQTLINLYNLTLKMEAACTSETSASWPTSTWHNNTRTESTCELP